MQDSINNQSMLKVGTILHGTYRIDSYLSSGGFGNTYVATNIEFDERMAIKEFFMKGVTQREGDQTTVSVSNSENTNSFLEQREKFKKEARRIRQLNNSHIVRVHDLFEENGTAYYVMDYVDGENLSERLKRTGKPMTEDEVNQILPQILDALKSIHDAGIWHLDLKPANIMVDKAGNVKLIDFGASKQLNAQKGGATTSTAISYTNGYAPREQMEQNYDKFGPWTDIYALGATLYNLLTNKRPPLPTDIDDDMSEDKHVALPFPEGVGGLKYLVLQMMKTNRLQRPRNVDAIEVADKQKQSSIPGSHNVKNMNWAEALRSTDEENEKTIIAEPTNEKEKKTKTKDRSNTVSNAVPNVSQEDQDNKNTNNSIRIWKAIGIIILFILACSILLPKGCNDSPQESDEQNVNNVELIMGDSMNNKTKEESQLEAKEVAETSAQTQQQVAEKAKQMDEAKVLIEELSRDFLSMKGGAVSGKEVEPFYISSKPVNQKLWQVIMGFNPSSTKGESLPVDRISWKECQKFINRINEISGLTFRMPTNDEWTYASTRGIEGTIWEWTTSSHCYSENHGYGKYSITRSLAYKEEMDATRVLTIKEKGLGFRLALDRK